MKKIFTTILPALVISWIFLPALNAQVPEGFNYQAVARNAAGEVISGTALAVRIAFVSDLNSTTVYWEEEHAVQTNDFGLFTLVVGDQSATWVGGTYSNFTDIDWSNNDMYLRPSIKQGAGSWQVMEPSPMVSVPFAMLARDTEAKQQLSLSGDNLLLSDGGSVSLTKYNSPFLKDVDTLYRVDGSLSLGSNRPLKSKLAVVSTDDASDDPLFEVRRKDGQPVFSVYSTGVQIHVEPTSGKGPSRGGFAIGGFDSEAKGVFQNFFTVEPDSIRMFIKETDAVKGPSRGGFAIGGFDESKGFVSNYFNVSAKSDIETYDDVAQMLWYPRKEAFLAGRILIPHSDSIGLNSTSLGYHSMAKGDFSQAFGHESKATGQNSTAIGNQAIARGSDSYAFGSGALATGQKSFAFGSVGVDENGLPTSTITYAKGDYSTALGMGAQAIQNASMALGVNATASGYASTSLGFYSQATDYYAVAIGYYSKSLNRYAHSFGLGAEASGYGSLALGMYAKSQGNYASSMGYRSEAKFPYSVAIGYYALAQADYSAAFGRSAQANGASSVAVGYGTVAGGLGAAAFGRSAVANGESSLSLGYSTDATQLYSTAIGYNSQSVANYTTAIGYNSTANQPYATAIGYLAQATGQDSYSFGSSSVASATKAVSIGISTAASANYSVAIGNGATASGDYATSLGYLTAANGLKSIAIGAHYSYTYYRFVFNRLTGGFTLVPTYIEKANTASDDYSIAFGNGNTSTGGGLALGTYNTARKIGSVAIGFSNYADSAYSFAAGYGNYARGINSFAMGESVTAQSANSFVIGTYNLIEGTQNEWIDSDPLFVIGNGESTSARSNAFKVLKNGNTYIDGYLQSPKSYSNGIVASYRDLYITSSGYMGYLASSIRYKQNVNDLEDIDWIYDLNPVTFTYIKDESNRIQYGLIAEEVEKVNKDFVNYGDDGLPETVTYSQLLTPLMKAVQIQKKEVDYNLQLLQTLQDENQYLRNQNDELRSRLEQLEAIVNQILEK